MLCYVYVINIVLVVMIEIKNKNKNNNKETDLPLLKHDVYKEDIIWPRGDGKILFESWKRRDISYLQATMLYSIYYINTNEIPAILLINSFLVSKVRFIMKL